jgi:GDP-mannose 6-dehydrogenase
LRIAVFGLGYVGCISAACFANEGHTVIGVDLNNEKVDIVNSGKSPIVEPGLDETIKSAVGNGNLHATTDYHEAVANSDISLVCVGTPSEKNGSITLDFIFRVAKQVGQAIREIDHYHVLVIRSTVLPGTHEKAVKIIADVSGKKPGEDFGACSNPEFLREGSALKDFYNPPYTVIGEMDIKSGDYLAEIYKSINAPLIRSKEEGVDSHKLMEIFCMDDKLNLSSYYLKPGFAFGGSCLPKDVRAITYRAKEHDLELPLLNSVMSSNHSHVERAIDLVISQGKKRIGILGLSFKGDTDDLRESPMVEVVERLIGKGYDIRIFDRNVQLAKLFGANKEYITQKIPHISNLMVGSVRDILNHAEVVIVGNHSKEFTETVQNLTGNYTVIDFVRIIREVDKAGTKYEGLCW